jgi:hypothetical protein
MSSRNISICNKTTLESPAYGHDLAPSDYHLFPALWQNLGSHNFKDDREMKTAVTRHDS